MNHPLDRPIWSALSTRHIHLSQGDGLARRYVPSIVPFAATANDADESLRSLEEIVPEGSDTVMLQADDIVLPPGLVAVSTALGVQMVAESPPEAVSDPQIERLADGDAADMLALASLAKPGPFSMRALELGDFWGIKLEGRLVAMAGERMKLPGYAELSGVCSHPDARGRGFGKLLSVFVAERIFAKGDQPFLHAYADNGIAVRLYESIGFEHRARMNVAVVRRRPGR